jgi:signal transduction histidine kinase
MRKSVIITYLAFIISLVILLGIGFNFYTRLLRYNYSISWIERTHEVLQELKNLENYFKEMESSQRGFLLTNDSLFIHPFEERLNAVRGSFSRLLQLTSENPAQQKRLKELSYIIARRIDILEESTALHKLDKTLFEKRLRAGREAMQECEVILRDIEKEEKRLLVTRRKMKDSYGSASSNYSVVIFTFSFVVFIITFLLIIRELSRRFRYQRELEVKITELNQTNAELEQITFAASHDLQEPLRKILTFSDMLKVKYKDALPADTQRLVERLQFSATRMHELVEDLMNFTQLVGLKEESHRVSLKEVVEEVQHELKDIFAAKDVKLSIDLRLPEITGYRSQLNLLFHSLLDNAVKFSKENVPPAIFILTQNATAEEMKEKFKIRYGSQRYIKIIVRDNGIGFDNEFAGRMFNLFQRLHSQQSAYTGKGIGLTIVKRIMTNHLGFVSAHGKVNEGAEFVLYFPVSESA